MITRCNCVMNKVVCYHYVQLAGLKTVISQTPCSVYCSLVMASITAILSDGKESGVSCHV
jgi:hypothetical protein